MMSPATRALLDQAADGVTWLRLNGEAGIVSKETVAAIRNAATAIDWAQQRFIEDNMLRPVGPKA